MSHKPISREEHPIEEFTGVHRFMPMPAYHRPTLPNAVAFSVLEFGDVIIAPSFNLEIQFDLGDRHNPNYIENTIGMALTNHLVDLAFQCQQMTTGVEIEDLIKEHIYRPESKWVYDFLLAVDPFTGREGYDHITRTALAYQGAIVERLIIAYETPKQSIFRMLKPAC